MEQAKLQRLGLQATQQTQRATQAPAVDITIRSMLHQLEQARPHLLIRPVIWRGAQGRYLRHKRRQQQMGSQNQALRLHRIDSWVGYVTSSRHAPTCAGMAGNNIRIIELSSCMSRNRQGLSRIRQDLSIC
jgi:hypothetical protein